LVGSFVRTSPQVALATLSPLEKLGDCEDALDLVNRETPLNPEQRPQLCPFSEFEIFMEPAEFEQG
jgi:hypothetical protein